MALSFLTPSRTVLLMADEALYIYQSSVRGVSLVETVPWGADNFEENVAHTIAKDCGKKPVLILNDMVEQHYRKERIPLKGVGVLDKNSMLGRKLAVAFPSYPVRAAFALKEKAPATSKGGAADIYIFAAVPGSEQFMKTVASVRGSFVSVAGLCLLPVESSDMVKTLSTKLSKTQRKKAKWAVFIGQHRNGGLRQIVTKDGELALTRMTLITDNDGDNQQWAAEVHQEFNATMSYLLRFGYQTDDGLDVIVVSNPEAGDILESLIEEECHYTSLTAPQVATTLGINIGRVDSPFLADALHVAWTANKSKFILPMKPPQLERISKPRQLAVGAMALLFCSGAFFAYQALSQYQKISEINADLELTQRNREQLDVQYQKEVQRKEQLGFDVKLIQSSIAVHDKLEAQRMEPLPLFKGIGLALGRDLRIDSIQMEKQKSLLEAALPEALTAEGQPALPAEAPPTIEARMQMTYPSTTNIDRGNEEIKELRGRLQTTLPGYKVEITKSLKDYEYVEEVIVESGDVDKQNVNQDFVAEMKITGPAKVPPAPTVPVMTPDQVPGQPVQQPVVNPAETGAGQ